MIYLKRLISIVLILTGIAYAGYFSWHNMDIVRIDVPLLGEFHVAGCIAYLACFVVGALFATLFLSIELARKSFQLRKSRKELSKAAKQPHKRVSRFLEEEAPARSIEEPIITRDDSKLY